MSGELALVFDISNKNHKAPKTEMIQNRKTTLSQGKMIILLQLNDIDIPPHECAEWPELRWSGGSCYGLSVMQINMASGHFMFDQQRKHEQISLSSRRKFDIRAQSQQSQCQLPWQHRQQNWLSNFPTEDGNG